MVNLTVQNVSHEQFKKLLPASVTASINPWVIAAGNAETIFVAVMYLEIGEMHMSIHAKGTDKETAYSLIRGEQ